MMFTLAALCSVALAEEPPSDPNGYYVGARGGVSVPINAEGLAFPLSAEAGIHFPSDLSLGLRFTYQQDPPQVFDYGYAPWAVGPLVEGRYMYPVNPKIELYGSVAGGFIFGIEEDTDKNIVMPILSGGAGARITPGGSRLYIATELGLTNFVVPYMGMALGVATKPDRP